MSQTTTPAFFFSSGDAVIPPLFYVTKLLTSLLFFSSLLLLLLLLRACDEVRWHPRAAYRDGFLSNVHLYISTLTKAAVPSEHRKTLKCVRTSFSGSRKAQSDGLALVDVGECTSLVLSESKARKCTLRRMTLLLPLIQVMRIPRNTEGYEAGT